MLTIISEHSEGHKVDDLFAYLSYMNVHRLYRVFHTFSVTEVEDLWNERLVSQTWIHDQVSKHCNQLMCKQFIARLEMLMKEETELSQQMNVLNL